MMFVKVSTWSGMAIGAAALFLWGSINGDYPALLLGAVLSGLSLGVAGGVASISEAEGGGR